MKSPVLTDLVDIIHIIIIQTISGEITSSDRPCTQSYISELYRTYLVKSPVLTDLIHNHTSIIETISGEITSSDWPDTQSYINYRDHIWWNHQFWPTWYTLYISELYRPYLVKSPVLTDLVHNHTSIIETISGEITSSDWPDTQSYINYRDQIWWNHQFWPTWYTLYISELYRPYLVKSPVLTDLLHNHTYQNYTEHIWWNHQFWLTWCTIIHQL